MPINHVLSDVDEGIWQDDWSHQPTPTSCISKKTLRSGYSDGVDVVTLNNGAFSVSLLPTRGMGLWKAQYNSVPLEWQSPVSRPVHPRMVNLEERNGLGWLTGFNELMCRCGLSFNGAPGTDRVVDNNGNTIETRLTLHGKIANSPAHRVVASFNEATNRISVTGVVDEAMMFGPVMRLTSTVSTELGSNSIRIEDTVTNIGGQPTELELLYHTNFGRPLLEEGSKLVAPIREMAPRDAVAANAATSWDTYAAPIAGFVEECYFFELETDSDGNTAVMLHNAAGDKAVRLSFAKSQLPCFTVWKNTQAEADGCVTGLEPATNYPNLKTFEREQGRVILLQPGQSYDTAFEIAAFDSADDVASNRDQIRSIESNPTIHSEPINRFSG